MEGGSGPKYRRCAPHRPDPMRSIWKPGDMGHFGAGYSTLNRPKRSAARRSWSTSIHLHDCASLTLLADSTTMIFSKLVRAPGQTRGQHISELLILLGRISFLIRLCRWILVDGYRHVRARGLTRSIQELYNSLRNASPFIYRLHPTDYQVVIRLMLSLPSSKKKIAEEMSKTRLQLREKIITRSPPDGAALTTTRTMPEEGRSREWLEQEWSNLSKLETSDVKDGQVSGTVYHASFQCHERRFQS